jgi:hypothetical protein
MTSLRILGGPHRSRDCGFLGASRTTGPHRLQKCGFLTPALSEGLPMPREPAYAAERSHDGEAKAASE